MLPGDEYGEGMEIAQHVLRPQARGGQAAGHRRVDAAGEAQHGA